MQDQKSPNVNEGNSLNLEKPSFDELLNEMKSLKKIAEQNHVMIKKMEKTEKVKDILSIVRTSIIILALVFGYIGVQTYADYIKDFFAAFVEVMNLEDSRFGESLSDEE